MSRTRFELALVSSFDQVIAPLTRDRFLDEYWSRQFLHLPGYHGKYGALLNWDELADCLEQSRLGAPRLRLAQAGKILDQDRYQFRREDGSATPIRGVGLLNCLASGATLILDQVDEMMPRVRMLAEDFRNALGAYTTANLYAGWRKQNGFDLHWDQQDTLIIQVDGRKRWQVYRPTRLHPLSVDLEKPARPSDEPIFDGILENGDAIYMPRGWWHMAFPMDEPSLHLTMTTVPPTGFDLLDWFVKGLKRHPEVRANLPHPRQKQNGHALLNQLRTLIMDDWSETLLVDFQRHLDSRAPARPEIRFPHQLAACPPPIRLESRVRLAMGDRLWLGPTQTNEEMLVRINDLEWRCAASLRPALEALDRQQAHAVGELCALLVDAKDAFRLKVFLATLSLAGAVWVE